MWQVGQKVKVKSAETLHKLRKDPSTSAKLMPGQIGTITHVEETHVILDIEVTFRGRTGGLWNNEIEPYIEESEYKQFKLTLKQGHAYEIKCTEEAVKELCEFVGDDALASINPIETKA